MQNKRNVIVCIWKKVLVSYTMVVITLPLKNHFIEDTRKYGR